MKKVSRVFTNVAVGIMVVASSVSGEKMSRELLSNGLQFAHKNHMIPIYLGNPYSILDEEELYRTHVIIDRAANLKKPVSEVSVQIPVIESLEDASILLGNTYSSVILLVNRNSIPQLNRNLETLSKKTRRINIMKQSIIDWSDHDIDAYTRELSIFRGSESFSSVSINVFDSRKGTSSRQCKAGRSDITLAPNGKFYACPAFYYWTPTQTLGSFQLGLTILEPELYELEKSSPCRSCTLTSCLRCLFANQVETSAINLASEIQCDVARREESLAQEHK